MMNIDRDAVLAVLAIGGIFGAGLFDGWLIWGVDGEVGIAARWTTVGFAVCLTLFTIWGGDT